MTPFENLLQIAQTRIPGFKVRYKSQDGVWKYLPKKLRRASTYIHCTRTCWLPEQSDKPVQWRRLAHEYLHAYDATKNYTYYLARYAFPQWLAIPLFIVLLTGYLFDGFQLNTLLLSLIPLLPWNSPTRAQIERRGYAATLYAHKLERGEVSSSAMLGAVTKMCSYIYYGMCTRRQAAKHMSDIMTEIFNGGPKGKPYQDIRSSILRGNPYPYKDSITKGNPGRWGEEHAD